jgi:hypothetical protein
MIRTPVSADRLQDSSGASPRVPRAPLKVPRRYLAWAELLRRVFAIDGLVCAGGGRRRVVATIKDPPVVQRILHHLGRPTDVPQPAPPRPPPAGRALAFDFPDEQRARHSPMTGCISTPRLPVL